MRLSTRIAIAVGVLVPLLVLASGWLLVRLVANDLHAQADAHLRERAAAMAQDARNLLRVTAADRSAAAEQAKEKRLFTSALDVGIRLVGPDGTVSGGPQPGPSFTLPADASRPATVRDGQRGWRVLSVPVVSKRPAATGTLWVFSPDTASQSQIQLVRRRVVTVALLGAPLAAAVTWLAATAAVRPLRRLQRRAAGLDPDTSAVRLDHEPSRITEVDDLARTLRTVLSRYDEQAARTAEALATARSFSAAASHELRTPLMSMRIDLDVLGGHPDLDPAERAEIVADLSREHARLLDLLVMLRALAQGDLVEADAFGPVDLAEVVESAAAALRGSRSGTAPTVRSGPGLVVHGWEPGLRSAVDNLLVNALTHGGGAVDVTLRAEREAVVLTVDDDGPGVPPESRQRVFERFRRGPDSPGSGLGLTLVAQQIALHRGTIRVVDRPGGSGGARFEVRLPLTVAGRPGSGLPSRRDWLTAEPADLRGPQGFHKDRS
ncbi:HAMP domain-containing sensor histidine kinase [Streptomyces sp. H39-S7]|nr:HAMP domain-containing sensor histidine kinase [Streptomyces sp. H39-S7]MCZ4119565.1 HAMP domain-containing sensor histidine kinase [Streptomyces sp. H39-S7]